MYKTKSKTTIKCNISLFASLLLLCSFFRPLDGQGCAKGEFKPDGGICTQCPEGSYQEQDIVDKTECKLCETGKYHNPGDNGQESCKSCKKYTYNFMLGWVGNCFTCFNAKVPPASSCLGCDPGKWRDESAYDRVWTLQITPVTNPSLISAGMIVTQGGNTGILRNELPGSNTEISTITVTTNKEVELGTSSDNLIIQNAGGTAAHTVTPANILSATAETVSDVVWVVKINSKDFSVESKPVGEIVTQGTTIWTVTLELQIAFTQEVGVIVEQGSNYGILSTDLSSGEAVATFTVTTDLGVVLDTTTAIIIGYGTTNPQTGSVLKVESKSGSDITGVLRNALTVSSVTEIKITTANSVTLDTVVANLKIGSTIIEVADILSAEVEFTCPECLPGYFTDDRDVGECAECPKGYYGRNLTIAARPKRYDGCESCPKGKYGDVKSAPTILIGCKNCVPGRYSESNGLMLQFQETAETTCKACVMGMYNTKFGSTTVSVCKACKSGFYSITLGAISEFPACIECEAGRFNPNVGSASEDDCKGCPKGYYQSLTGQAYCLDCTPGTRQSQIGKIECEDCQIGRAYGTTRLDTDKCDDCPVGYHMPIVGQADCRSCSPGTYQENTGAAQCELCNFTTYTDQQTSTECLPCAIGKYADLLGSANCQNCPSGKFGTPIGSFGDFGQGACLSCPLGWKRSQGDIQLQSSLAVVVTECIQCDLGESTQSKGAASCLLCEVGQYGTYLRELSPDGLKYVDVEPKGGNCTKCKIGQHQTDKGKASCKVCINGDINSVTSECSQCGMGEHGDAFGVVVVKDKNKKVIRKEAFNTEKDYSDPSYLPINDDLSCVSCEVGRFSDGRGESNCKDCLNGLIPNSQSTNCKKPEWTVAQQCTKGQYLQDNCTELKETFGDECTSAQKIGIACIDPVTKVPYGEEWYENGCASPMWQEYGWSCTDCPPGADCDANNASLSDLRTLAGFWRIPYEFEPIVIDNIPILFARCPFKDDCLGRALYNDTKCAPEVNHDIKLCARCKIGYQRTGVDCAPCEATDMGVRGAILAAVLLLLGGIFVKTRKRIFRFTYKYRAALKDAGLAVKLVVSFLQISLSLPGMLPEMQFPDIYQSFMVNVNVVNFDFMALIGVQCLADVDFRMSLLVSAGFPLGVTLFMATVYKCLVAKVKRAEEVYMPEDKRKIMDALFDLSDANLSGVISETDLVSMFEFVNNREFNENVLPSAVLHKMMRRAGSHRPRQKHGKWTITKANFIKAGCKKKKLEHDVMLSSYVPILEVQTHVNLQKASQLCFSITIQLFLVLHAPVSAKAFLYFDCHKLGDKLSLLRSDYSLECGSSDYNFFLPIALGLLIGFTFALPGGISYYMYKKRKTLHGTTVRAQIGFLYSRFNNGVEFWEVHELLRKMVFTGVLVYVPPAVRPTVALLLCVFACCTLNFFKPYKNPFIFWIGEITFILTMLKYLVVVFALSMQTKDGRSRLDSKESLYLGYVLISIEMVVLIGMVFCVFLIFTFVKTQAEDIIAEELMSDSEDEDEEEKVQPNFMGGISMHSLKHAIKVETVRQIKKSSAQHKKVAMNVLTKRLEAADVRLSNRLSKRRRRINGLRIKQGLEPLYGGTAANGESKSGGFGEGRKDHVDTLFDDLHATEHLEVDSLFNNLHESEEKQMADFNTESNHIDSLFDGLCENAHQEVDDLFSNLDKVTLADVHSVVLTPTHRPIADFFEQSKDEMAELVEAVRKSVGKSVQTESRLAKIIKRLDSDGSGELSQEEFWPLIEYMLKGNDEIVLTEELVDAVWNAVEIDETKDNVEIGTQELAVWLGFIKPTEKITKPTPTPKAIPNHKKVDLGDLMAEEDSPPSSSPDNTTKILSDSTFTVQEDVDKLRLAMKSMVKNERRLKSIIKMIDDDKSGRIGKIELHKLCEKVLKKQKMIIASPELMAAVWVEVSKLRKDMKQEELGTYELCVWLGFQEAEHVIEQVAPVAKEPKPTPTPTTPTSTPSVPKEEMSEDEKSVEKLRSAMESMVKNEKRLLGIIKMIDNDKSGQLGKLEFDKLCMKVLKKQKDVKASPELLKLAWTHVRTYRNDMKQEEIGDYELCVWLGFKEPKTKTEEEKTEEEKTEEEKTEETKTQAPSVSTAPITSPPPEEIVVEKVRLQMKNMIKTEKRLVGILKMIDADASGALNESEFNKLVKKVLKKQTEIIASPDLLAAIWSEVSALNGNKNELDHLELTSWLGFENKNQSDQAEKKLAIKSEDEIKAEKVRVSMKNMIKTEKRLVGILKMIDGDGSGKLNETEFIKLCKKVLKKQKEIKASPELLSCTWTEVRKHRKDMSEEEIGHDELVIWLELNMMA